MNAGADVGLGIQCEDQVQRDDYSDFLTRNLEAGWLIEIFGIQWDGVAIRGIQRNIKLQVEFEFVKS